MHNHNTNPVCSAQPLYEKHRCAEVTFICRAERWDKQKQRNAEICRYRKEIRSLCACTHSSYKKLQEFHQIPRPVELQIPHTVVPSASMATLEQVQPFFRVPNPRANCEQHLQGATLRHCAGVGTGQASECTQAPGAAFLNHRYKHAPSHKLWSQPALEQARALKQLRGVRLQQNKNDAGKQSPFLCPGAREPAAPTQTGSAERAAGREMGFVEASALQIMGATVGDGRPSTGQQPQINPAEFTSQS